MIQLLTKTMPSIAFKTEVARTICKLFVIIPEACCIIMTIGILTQVYMSKKRKITARVLALGLNYFSFSFNKNVSTIMVVRLVSRSIE
jgi:hypothetical protein